MVHTRPVRIWPSRQPILLRPVVTYIALALMIYPTYLGLRNNSVPEMRSTQTIVMTDNRSVNQNFIDATKPLSIVFRVTSADAGATLIVQVKDESGAVIFNDPNFTSLSNTKLGTITFDEDILAPGQYFLTVSNQIEELLVEYTFQVE